MKFGPFSFEIGKSYEDLVTIINRSKGSSVEKLKGTPQKQLREYKSWVFSCVSLISERSSTVEYGFYRKDTGEELFSNNKGYKVFSKPFKQPNNFMSFRFIKSFCQIQMDLCGMSVIYKAKNRLGQVWELWPLNMNDYAGCEVTGDFLNPKVTYTFNFDTHTHTFDQSELLIFKYPHPLSLYEPMSPIQAQAYAVDIDAYVEVYERDFFKNSARIDMALYTEQEIDQDKADDIKNRWKSKYSGNFHDVAVLSSGLKPIPLNFTNKDFEFLNLAGWSADKIFATYKVPKSKLGQGGQNRASSVTDDISFNRECIQPRLTLFDEVFTSGVLSSFNDNVEFRHYNPIPRDRDLEIKEARVYLSGLPSYTINEYRKETKMGPPIEGGDRLLIPKGWIPIDRLDEFIDLRLSNRNSSSGNTEIPLNETDPERHENDDPKVNPDGTDDRDENPTDGRSLDDFLCKFSEIEEDLRETWNQIIYDYLSKCDKDNLKEKTNICFSELIKNTVGIIFKSYGVDSVTFDEKNWASSISERAAKEYSETFFKAKNADDWLWFDFVKDQFATNPRLIKITNSLLRATINYTKWLIFNKTNREFIWKINSNECVHRGRLKQVEKSFEVGGTRLDFPNQILNFSCDCTIIPKEK